MKPPQIWRISFGHKFPVPLYQAEIFQTGSRILDEISIGKSFSFEDYVQFLKLPCPNLKKLWSRRIKIDIITRYSGRSIRNYGQNSKRLAVDLEFRTQKFHVFKVQFFFQTLTVQKLVIEPHKFFVHVDLSRLRILRDLEWNRTKGSLRTECGHLLIKSSSRFKDEARCIQFITSWWVFKFVDLVSLRIRFSLVILYLRSELKRKLKNLSR